MSGMPPNLQKEIGVQGLREGFCVTCMNMACVRAQGFSSKWEARMERQEEALHRPVFGDIHDPNYKEIHEQAFISLYDASAKRDLWSPVLTLPAKEDEVLQEEGVDEPDYTPQSKEAPVEDHDKKREALARLKAAGPVLERKTLPNPINTHVPPGGILLSPPDQNPSLPSREIRLNQEVDTWAPKTPVGRGGKKKNVIKLSGGGHT